MREIFTDRKDTADSRVGQGLPFRCQNAAEFFFSDQSGLLPKEPSLKTVDKLFAEYTRVLTQMYETIRNRYNYFLTTFLREE